MNSKTRLFSMLIIGVIALFLLFKYVFKETKKEPVQTSCVVKEITESDSDGDGLSDKSEEEGWDVIITQTDGSSKIYHVTSDPNNPDTNGDGICDSRERMYSIDPNKKDTDLDGLSDFDELTKWASDPRNMDTDGDSNGNPLLFDGSEVTKYFTSPVMKDSDGDGLSDHYEITQMSERFNPLIANVPEVRTDIVGTTNLQLNFQSSQTSLKASDRSVEFEQAKSNEYSSTDSRTHEVTAELSASLSVKAEANAFPPGASVSAEASVTATAGYSYTNNNTVSESSALKSRNLYGKVEKVSHENQFTTQDANLTVAYEITNSGPVSYSIKDMTVIAILRDPRNPTLFKPIAELNLGSLNSKSSEITLSPGSKSNTLSFTVNITHDAATELLRNPEMLFFEVSRFELYRQIQETDREINEAFLREVTSGCTGQVVIDYGNGSVVQERVATNTMRTDGQVRGNKLSHILKDILEIDYSTQSQLTSDGSEGLVTLHSLKDNSKGEMIENRQQTNEYWAIVGSNGLQVTGQENFDDIILSAGNTVHLIYVKDEDRDGLFASEEYRYGTYDNQADADANGVNDAKDSDGDGISDWEEVKQGWTQGDLDYGYGAAIIKNVQVFSDPSSKDSDNDGWSDSKEKEQRTDPLRPDTDADGTIDSKDAKPLYRATMTALIWKKLIEWSGLDS